MGEKFDFLMERLETGATWALAVICILILVVLSMASVCSMILALDWLFTGSVS